MADVNISRGQQEGYNALEYKDPDTIYICLDTGRMYVGEKLIADNIQANWLQTDERALDYIRNLPWYAATGGEKIYYNGADVTNDTAMRSSVAHAKGHWYGTQSRYNALVDAGQVEAGVAYHIKVLPDWNETDTSHLGYIKNQPNILDMEYRANDEALAFFYTRHNQRVQ